PVQVIQYPSNDTAAYNVNSALIVGQSDAILIDAQMRKSDAEKEADQIAALGKHLRGIFITHPDEDHYFGLATFVERFPGTPVYMTAAAIEEYKKTSQRFFEGIKRGQPKEAPDSLVTPLPLPSNSVMLDGKTRIEFHEDEQGDVLKPSNSFVWIPSIRTVITG